MITKKAHYVAPLKENNKSYYEDIELYFNDKDCLKKAKYFKVEEKAHSQIETREYYFTNDVDWINEKDKWTILKSIGLVKRITEKSVETRYFISDLDMNEVEFIANVIRNEWSIENKLHWYLDTVFKEDNNKCYLKKQPKKPKHNKKILFRILKQVKDNYKMSLNLIRLSMLMDFENEIERLLKML
ncbi:MAG: ISAs1 family transposase [Bacilli bacterium]